MGCFTLIFPCRAQPTFRLATQCASGTSPCPPSPLRPPKSAGLGARPASQALLLPMSPLRNFRVACGSVITPSPLVIPGLTGNLLTAKVQYRMRSYQGYFASKTCFFQKENILLQRTPSSSTTQLLKYEFLLIIKQFFFPYWVLFLLFVLVILVIVYVAYAITRITVLVSGLTQFNNQ